MFNTLQEAVDRRNADMKFIATSISRELHRRGWQEHLRSTFNDLNTSLTYPLPLSTALTVEVEIRFNFNFSDTYYMNGTRGEEIRPNDTDLINFAYDNGSWDEGVRSDPMNYARTLISIDEVRVLEES